MRTYYVGLSKDCGSGWTGDPERVIVNMRQSVNCLPPDIWRYHGAHITTKKAIRAKRKDLLAAINETYGTEFTKITID